MNALETENGRSMVELEQYKDRQRILYCLLSSCLVLVVAMCVTLIIQTAKTHKKTIGVRNVNDEAYLDS